MRSGRLRPTAGTQRAPRTPVGINVGVGAVLVVAAALVAAAMPASDGQWRRLPVTVAVATAAAVTGDQLALAGVVPLAWLVGDGFLENRLGELSWHGSTDLYLILQLVVAAAIGLAAGEAHRQVRAFRHGQRRRT